jgi:hypothetical protein
VEVVLTANMEDIHGNVQQQWSNDPIYIAVGQTVTGQWNGLEHTGTGYHNGPANFSFSLQNEEQTGWGEARWENVDVVYEGFI